MGGMECGDMTHDLCDTIPWCLRLTKENECDEVKEMDCQDLGEHACGDAMECAWIFDERFLCLEKKEIETMQQNQLPPIQKLRKSRVDSSTKTTTVTPAWQLLTVLVIFGCLGFVCTRACLASFKKRDVELLLTEVV